MTLKIPVISTNCNAGPSEILLNGKGGDLVRVGDFNNMGKKIILHFKNKKILKKKTNFARKKLNRFDINYHVKLYKKIFDKISTRSSYYIKNSFKTSLNLLKTYQFMGLVNGPISKKHFLNKKYLGITEYLSKKTNSKKNPTMLIYNSKISVSPVTTHLPIKFVTKNLNKNKIINNVLEINKF